MEDVMETSKTPEKCQTSEGTWIQITFTLAPEYYKTLWERAVSEHLTIPDFVRESVMDALRGMEQETSPAPATVVRDM